MIEKFNQKLYEIDWSEVKACENPSKSNKAFLTRLFCIYDAFLTR